MLSSAGDRASAETTGCVFNTQRFSVHDGPGIRTLVFLSGCPLRCAWCCNPESQTPGPQLAYNEKKCLSLGECGNCLKVCPEEALLAKGEPPQVFVDRARCTNCGDCAAACPATALAMFGKYMTVNEILGEVEQDSCFYSRSGGGLTVSGGEPLSQPGFTLALLQGARRLGIETAIETCGHGKWDYLDGLCQHLDSIFYDLKSLDPDKHQEFTGVANELILENFRLLVRAYPQLPITVRTPIIPGFNDGLEEVARIARFIEPYANVTYEMMPYHAFAESKYTFLGRRYTLAGVRPPTSEQMRLLRSHITPGSAAGARRRQGARRAGEVR